MYVSPIFHGPINH